MRRRWVSLVLVFVLFAVSQNQALAIINDSPNVYRIKVAQCVKEPKARIQTGFRVEGIDGIITALHGVVGCETIIAIFDDDDDNNDKQIFSNLKIVKVDIERDVALLWSDDMENAPSGGFRVASPEEPEGYLEVLGYPLGYSIQRPLPDVRFLTLEKLIDRIPDNDPAKKVLQARGSPSLDIIIIDLKASLLPGHSGAPLLTADGRVYGVANGGLKGGAIEISWAIPWHDIDLHPRREEERRLTSLAYDFPLSDLSFSSTFPDYPPVDDPQDLATGEVRSYRAVTFMTLRGGNGDKALRGWLGFKTSYNKDRDQRSLVGLEQWQVFDQDGQQEKLVEEAHLIFSNQDHYLSLGGFEDECLKLDELPEGVADLVEQNDQTILTSFDQDDLAFASYLGPDEINGEETKHYLLSEPIPMDVSESGEPLSEMIGAELWITVDSNQLRKLSFEMTVHEDSSAAEQSFSGDIYVEVEYYDINTDIRVDLPLACQNVSPDSSSSQPAASNGKAVINEEILVEHNGPSFQGPGMSIMPTFTVENLARKRGVAIARVFTENGMPLLTYSLETGTLDGIYQAWENFRPRLEQETFENLEIFVPYGALSLSDGLHNLKFQVYIYDVSSKEVLAKSDFQRFSLRQQTDLDGNQNWFSDDYSGLSGLPVAGQTEVSPAVRDVGHFLSHAFEAETWAYWDEDASVAEPYFGGDALLNLQQYIKTFQEEALIAAIEFDDENSFIVNMSAIDDNTLKVNVCRYLEVTFIDQSGEPASEQPLSPGLYPRTVILERNPGSWWLITGDNVDEGQSCQLASDTAASSPQPAPGDGRAAISAPIPVEHNVSGDQGPGMSIRPTFMVENRLDMPGVAIARIYFENERPLQAYSPETRTFEGIYQVLREFTPPYEQTTFNNWEIFVPYGDLHLVDGLHNLKFRIFIYDFASETVLAESDFYDFSLWQQTDDDGNPNWLSDNYAGLNGLKIAGQEAGSPLEQDVGHFLSHALEVEMQALTDQDPSIIEPYLSADMRLKFQDYVEGLQDEGYSSAAEFDEQNSFIVEMRVVDENTVEVDLCVLQSFALFDQAGELLDEETSSLTPQTRTLERNPGGWWIITAGVENPDGLSCQAAGDTATG